MKEHQWRIWLLCCLINLFLQTHPNSGKQAAPPTPSHELNISRDHSLGHVRPKTRTPGLLLMAVCFADGGPASIGSCRQWEEARRRGGEAAAAAAGEVHYLFSLSLSVSLT